MLFLWRKYRDVLKRCNSQFFVFLSEFSPILTFKAVNLVPFWLLKHIDLGSVLWESIFRDKLVRFSSVCHLDDISPLYLWCADILKRSSNGCQPLAQFSTATSLLLVLPQMYRNIAQYWLLLRLGGEREVPELLPLSVLSARTWPTQLQPRTWNHNPSCQVRTDMVFFDWFYRDFKWRSLCVLIANWIFATLRAGWTASKFRQIFF